MKRSLADLAEEVYINQRARRRIRKQEVTGPPLSALPPFSLGVVGKKERKDVIRSQIRKKTRVIKREKLFFDCISEIRRVPLPVLIELAPIARSLFSDDNADRLNEKFSKAHKNYFKIGEWDQDEYDPGTGKGNIYAVRHMGQIYIVVYDFEGECVCSIPVMMQ